MILELLLGKDFGGGSMEAVVQEIAKELKNKRYLLVLDDIWHEVTNWWDKFKTTLVEVSSNKGNFIMVTTRKENVASIVNTCHHPCYLRSLTERDCWSIIRTMTFQDEEVPEPFKITGLEIARKCRGLPLAASVIGRVLRGREIEEWNSVLQWFSNLEEGENGVLRVLKESYDRLPSASVKKCFVYCSLFVKDSVMDREDLIQLWMAEGFLPNNKKSEMETIGNEFFNILLQNFFFQEPEEDDYRNIISCKMHDLVHDLACIVSKSVSFMNMESRTADDILQVRHLLPESIGEETRKDIKEAGSYLRTLFLTCSVPDEILPYFKNLHVLKLCGANIQELPTSIGNLKHLRYLDVSKNANLTTLPKSVCNLYILQTLRILSCYSFQRLPRDLQFLIRLRHLCFNYVGNDFEMPPNIGSLSCLQTLPLFCVSGDEGCRIDELGKLKKLKGKLEIRNLELVSCKTEAEEADMAGKLNIYKLHFLWRESTDSSESNINDESVLEGLQPHEKLKGLTIRGFRGKNFPFWTRNMGIYKSIGGCLVIFDQLIEIEIRDCYKCEEIPMLGHLPLLKDLYLNNLRNVRRIRPSFYGESDCCSTSSNDGQGTRESFPSLKRLTIGNMLNLTEWEEAQTSRMQVFPCLEYLKIYSCKMLVHIPHFRGSGAFLKEMKISECDELRELPYDLGSLQSLEKLEIIECSKLANVPHLRGSGASLKKMRISECDELRELPYDLGSLQSLEKLEINDCRNLQSISYQNGQEGLLSLRRLEIVECYELSNLPNEMLECSKSLQSLSARQCQNLTSLPDMKEMESLQSLIVSGCSNLTSLPKMRGMGSLQSLIVSECSNLTLLPKLSGIGCLNSLIELEIGRFSNSMQFYSFQDFFDGIEHIKSLEKLKLIGQADWASLPYQLQHLTSLKEMKINDFGMEALPEWFGNLSSLEELRLLKCEKLRHLPSREAMQRLTKLTQLYIWSCPLLEERCKAESDSDFEWSKITHIFDHEQIENWSL